MINYLLKTFIRKNLTTKNIRNVDELLYYKNVYPTYMQTAVNFQFAVTNEFLNSRDIQIIIDTLNKYISKTHYSKNYKYKTYKNHAQEIYDKLQCRALSKQQILKINKYIIEVESAQKKKINIFVPVPHISQP